MKSQLIHILCIYFMWNFKSCRCDCIVQERANFSTVLELFPGPGPWQLMANTSVLADCTDVMNCTAINADISMTWNGTAYHINIYDITIANFQNAMLTFSHQVDNVTYEVCRSMEIYASPHNISCDRPAVIKGTVFVSCTVNLISVPIACTFHSPWLLGQGNVTYSSAHVPPYYYNKVCTLSYRVAASIPGSYVFNVSVDCVLSNSSIGCGNAVTPSIEIDLPKAEIISCPSGAYIRNNIIQAGSLATCTCELTSAGYPSGHAMWYSSDNGSLTVTVSDQKAILHLVYTGISSSNPEYMCRAYSELGFSDQESSFQPSFAYGPSEVFITVNPSVNNIDICPGRTTEIIVTCTVPRNTVKPDIIMNIQIDKTIISATNSTDLTNYQLTLRHVFNTSGSYVISCHVQNSLFENLSNFSEAVFNVREPPKLLPVILVNGTAEFSGLTNNVVNISTGEEVTLSCIVRGGVPLINTTNLTCDDPTVMPAANGSVTVRRKEGNRVICNCTASHVTGCYTNGISSLRLAWLRAESEEPQSKDEESKTPLIIGLAVGLPLAVILLVLVLTCEIKRRRSLTHPPKRTERPSGYDTTNLQDTTDNQNYDHVTIEGDAPVIEELESYQEPPEIESGQKNARKIARPDSKEKVSVEQVGSETRITLESNMGRWKYLRSKITKRSLRNKPQHENPSLSIASQKTNDGLEL
ncbi:unnamed protein product [Lymnaea stagnalis]|uniref:Ig-like domain-containing protein n=1 Tax=Lymnaea stagnalis TaxID=6523 RepID=A0AAV2I2W8_LYMST